MSSKQRKEAGAVGMYSKKIKLCLGVKEEVFEIRVMSRGWPGIEEERVY